MLKNALRNIKCTVEYDGTNYSGWQKVPGKRTIQETVESVLSRLLNEPVKITGAGRTDAGVHALGQVFNFNTGKSIPVKNIQKALGKMLPDDIIIRDTAEVNKKFHARFSVKMKIYRYVILNSKTPLLMQRNFNWQVKEKLAVKDMRKAAVFLKGRRDFKIFSAGEERENTVRVLKDIKITRKGRFIFLDFYGKAFLRRMVRIMSGLLVQAGSGRLKPGEVKKIVKKKIKFHPIAAPAKGLFLKEVLY
jgi:tRNA pseudouridine38-40 synthase